MKFLCLLVLLIGFIALFIADANCGSEEQQDGADPSKPFWAARGRRNELSPVLNGISTPGEFKSYDDDVWKHDSHGFPYPHIRIGSASEKLFSPLLTKWRSRSPELQAYLSTLLANPDVSYLMFNQRKKSEAEADATSPFWAARG